MYTMNEYEQGLISSLIATAISNGTTLRKNSSRLELTEIANFRIYSVQKCENPGYNYTFKGYADIVKVIPTEAGNDSQTFPLCEISGDALIENDKAIIVNGISIDRGM